ncbi:unnamed protein product [Rhizophagus irregularis]|nr:unnamed protein product [Rhizophagus irregularis]
MLLLVSETDVCAIYACSPVECLQGGVEEEAVRHSDKLLLVLTQLSPLVVEFEDDADVVALEDVYISWLTRDEDCVDASIG